MKRIKNLIAAMAVLIVGSGTLAAQDVNDVIDKYNEAVELYSAKNYAEAIPALQAAVALGHEVGPDAAQLVQDAQKLIPNAYFRIGVASAQAGDFDAAIENCNTAMELGELYGDMNTVRNAGTVISKAYFAKGAHAFNSEDYKTAISIFESGYAANPNDTDLALNLAKSYAEDGQLEKAREVYSQIIGLTHSKYADAVAKAKEELAVYIIVAANEANGANDTATAYALLDSFLEVVPDSPTANLVYMQIATGKQDWSKIIEKGEAAAAAQVDDDKKSDVYYFLGAAYQNRENKAKAIENYRKVTAGQYVSNARTNISSLQ